VFYEIGTMVIFVLEKKPQTKYVCGSVLTSYVWIFFW
jgi:hypothetical protein